MTLPSRHRLLVVDDEPDLRTLYELTLLREGYHIETADGVEAAWQLLQEAPFSAVITDMRLPDGTGLELIQRLDAAGRSEPAIVITAYGSAENAVSALKAGAYDYLTKPVDLKQFRAVVASALREAESQTDTKASALRSPAPSQPAALPPRPGTSTPAAGSFALSRLVGHSPPMQQVRVLIDKVSRSMAPVLLWGESGTGKELVARAIHELSARAHRPFVAVNCGAIPEHLLEAEFFGHRKGSFTGATEDREGFFQAADGGTLFLDEIGDLPMSMQSKLLRAIQERAVRPVGATAEMPLDVRIVSASHKDLAHEVQAQRFRQDLFYRLNVIRIALPSLRERMSDLPLMCQHILHDIARSAGMHQAPQLSQAALQRLQQHRFDGNVRELENLLHRATALASQPVLSEDDLGLPPLPTDTPPTVASTQTSAQTLPPAAAPIAAPPQGATLLPADLVAHLDAIEREILMQALAQHRLNRTAAGASLGLSLRQMRYRMARLGVHVNEQGLQVGAPAAEDEDLGATGDAP